MNFIFLKYPGKCTEPREAEELIWNRKPEVAVVMVLAAGMADRLSNIPPSNTGLESADRDDYFDTKHLAWEEDFTAKLNDQNLLKSNESNALYILDNIWKCSWK